jgi:methylenetetrahydrofolate dehydrogenase (NADP+) / methenyltetrahydrofolate cyclohydrolase
MSARIIDGKAVAASVQEGVRDDAGILRAQHGVTPGLATVLVGEQPASRTYVAMKQKMCQELGMFSVGSHLSADVSQDELLAIVRRYADDPKIHGILVQLPLPSHLDQELILGAVPIDKDVDGFNPINVGRLAMKNREPMFVPCTPKGVITLIDSVGTRIEGARAVVLGRSNIVGLPAAFLLIHRHATVTVCHSRTRDLPDIVRQADIIVAAIGRARFVKADWIKAGATVIDVGTNSIPDATKKSGHRLVGDVDFEPAKEVAGAITPVPGGVGPMTIAMLMRNTCDAAMRSAGLDVA